MPEFHASTPAHENWKGKVLSAAIQLDEIDTAVFTNRYDPTDVDLQKVPVPIKAS